MRSDRDRWQSFIEREVKSVFLHEPVSVVVDGDGRRGLWEYFVEVGYAYNKRTCSVQIMGNEEDGFESFIVQGDKRLFLSRETVLDMLSSNKR